MNGNQFSNMNQNWKPQEHEQKIKQIIELIKKIMGTNNVEQREAFEAFHELKKQEEFSALCAAIFHNKLLSIDIRQRAGFFLKEALRNNFRKQNGSSDNMISDNVLNACKQLLIQCLCEDDEGSKKIRDTAAITINTIVTELHKDQNNTFNRYSKFDEWPELIEGLINLLKSGLNQKNVIKIQSILNLIHLLSHDCGKLVAECDASDDLIEHLFICADIPNDKIREYCLKSLYYLFHCQPSNLLAVMNKYVGLIQRRMDDTKNAIILKVLIDSIIVIMNEYWSLLSNNNNEIYIKKIFDFMLSGTENIENEVSCTAAEFWALYATDPSKDNRFLCDYFKILIPTLMKKCVYTEDILSLIDFENDSVSQADKAEDIAPSHYKSRAEKGGVGVDVNMAINDGGNGNEEKYPAAMDAEESSWNIRKCCATQLEKLSFSGHDLKQEILKYALPQIQNALQSEKALDREAGLLILGAITQKEYESITPELPKLIPYILKQANTDNILVQQIALWSLARFSNWYYSSNEGHPFFEPVLYQFFHSMLSTSKRVRRAACGAVAAFVTSTKEKILSKEDYIIKMMQTFEQSFKSYNLRNFPQLIDVMLVCTNIIAQHTTHQQSNGHHENTPKKPNDNILCQQRFQDSLMKQTIIRWRALENDTNIFPLFEAITTWSTYIGHTEYFQKTYLKDIFDTTMSITIDIKNRCREYDEYHKTVHGVIANGGGQHMDDNNNNNNGDDNDVDDDQYDENEPEKPNKEFWVCGLDLLAVLVEKCNPCIGDLIWNQRADSGAVNYQRFLEMLYCAICETHFNVRRNALALLGDIITLHTQPMAGHIDKFISVIIANLNYDWQTVCTNASWCIGQALDKYGPNANMTVQEMMANKSNKQQMMERKHGDNVMDQYCDEILCHLVEILKASQSPPYIVTNIAITMARLVKNYPSRIIKKWDQFAVEWIRALAMFQEDADKIDAFQILMLAVMMSPLAVVQSHQGCQVLFQAIASWQNPPKSLNECFQKVLIGFKNAAPNWNGIMNKLDNNTQQILRRRYNV